MAPPVRPPQQPPATEPKSAAEPKKYAITFEKTPWKDVFVWYASATGLTQLGTEIPTGTLTFATKRDRPVTLVELTDLINDVLLAQKWLLIRQEKTFTVATADEVVDPKFVTHVELNDLPKRGRTELVSVHIPLSPESGPEAETVVRKLVGPFGTAKWYPPANTLMVRDTAENLRALVKTVRALEGANKKKPNEK